MSPRTSAGAALAAISLLALAACGTSAPATDAPSTADPAAGGPVTITDSNGEEVTLDTPATRVVTLEWNGTESALALGVEPVGIADIDGFGQWVSSVEVTGDPIDVGLRGEPSIESVAQAEPDLIIGTPDSVPAEALEQMQEIAPVVTLAPATADDPIGGMEQNLRDMATLLGADAEADALMQRYDDKVAEATETISAAGAEGTPFIFSFPNTSGNSIDFRMHSDGAVSGAVLTEIGLTNAATGEGDPAYGIYNVDVEGLTELDQDAYFLYWENDSEDSPVDQLNEYAVWRTFGWAEDDRVVPAANRIWVYGSPASMIQWIDQVTGIVTQ